jgi:hemoglobin/transferrin/lactoferrin receptor protein
VIVAFPASCFRPPFQPCDAGTTTSANIARARLEGAEAEARYEDDRIALAAIYSETRGRNRATNAFLGVLAPRKLTLDGRMKFPGVGLVAGMRVRAADDFTAVNRAADRRDGYVVADLYARWRPTAGPLSAFTLSAAVENAGDVLYERAFAGVPEPGRTVKISLSWAGAGP